MYVFIPSSSISFVYFGVVFFFVVFVLVAAFGYIIVSLQDVLLLYSPGIV